MVVALAVTVSARASPFAPASPPKQARATVAPIRLVAIEASVHVGRGLGSGRTREDDVPGSIDGLRVAGDAPGARHPGWVPRELRRNAVTGGPACAAVR